ncbi:hypothetical protein [Halosimplex amylolyticum]|uniref:hypothetical protein n=1 Tax=Halosimplex amylolyticum TaxID=3396616 RepID=UPI003F575517
MAENPKDIELRRFARPIGVTGLGATAAGRTEHRLATVTGSFDGVLATGVRAGPGGPPTALSYLTLAPLVARAFASEDRDARSRSSPELSPPGEEAVDGDRPDADEEQVRVREVIRGDATESTADDLLGRDLTVSSSPSRRDAGDVPDGQPDGRPDPTQHEGRGRFDGRDGGDRHDGDDGQNRGGDSTANLTVSDPVRTVVEESTSDADGTATVPAAETLGDAFERNPPGGNRSESGETSARGPGAAETVPTTVASAGSPTAAASGRSPGDVDRGPSLTVTGGSGPSIDAVVDGVEESVADADSGSDRGSGAVGERGGRSADATGDDGVAERTVIQSDGRVNERVLDRLYEEFDRKMRREREREGR